MITKENITRLIEEKIAGSDMFIVEVDVRPGNLVDVTMDADSGITIEACTEIHRHILKNIDRELIDYGLDVSSPDLSKPLKVKRQYVKNIGRSLNVKTLDNAKTEGLLTNVSDHGVALLTKNKEEVEGKKGKKWVERSIEIPFEQIKEAKVVISFK
ncbi:MAG: ribosome assembly cofactor RimP [Flavobacteriales bacterium]